MILKSFCIISLLSFNIILCESNDKNIISVRLRNTLINGETETTVDGKEINVFKGIPYAEPPIDDLRFRKPLPLKEWPNILNANNWPNVCHQDTKMFPGDLFLNLNMSEDCLYLNIWTPKDSISSSSTELKPVIFYIHGGALIYGSSNWKTITGEILSAKGDVVFVNINYRLGTLGFLYSGTDDAPGNVGLWDQALALEWVNDNIKYFGGDPDKITIMGLSAGSWSASLLIMSPITRNLFHNAILQSGAYSDNLIDGSQEDHTQKWLKAAELIGCNGDKSEEFSPQIIDCLRKADPSSISMIPLMPEMKFQSVVFFTLVVVDGVFLPKKPSELLSSGDYKQNLNLLISTAVDEGSCILPYNTDGKTYNPMNPSNMTLSESINELTELSSKMSDKFQINGKEVSKLYFMGLPDDKDYNLYRRTIGIAVGDYYLTCPSLMFAKEVFKNSHFKNNVYQMYFNVKFGIYPEWFGPSHGEDMSPTHGIPFIHKEKSSDEDRNISEQMIKIFTDFAKNGEPTPQSGIVWPKYYTVDDNIIAPYYEITRKPKPETNFGIGLKITECEYLWNKYLVLP